MKRIGVCGCGNMGEVLVESAKSLVGSKNVFCFDIDSLKLKRIRNQYNVQVVKSNIELVEKSDVFIVAVKPQQIKELFNEISRVVDKNKVVVSIAAGIKIKTISSFLCGEIQIIRAMPNLPLKVGSGVTAICKNKFCTEKNYLFVKQLFEKKGVVIEIPETKMDLITAFSGSGPAYIFYIAEILERIANKLGLPKRVIPIVVNYTILGAAEMLVKQKLQAKVLKDAVTSKGGTTEQALKVFYENNLDGIFFKAVNKAFLRAKELSQLLSKG
ncbi:MAG: pyrroline-5-carboxylate reductase [Endomicrobia bacterium]|nr:pyrroline-5-carboxylate reductase [Endomicrobiia bacterium]